MRTPQANLSDLAAKLEKIRAEAKNSPNGSWPEADVSPELWGTMLDLIYTGRRNRAWQFLEEAWPQKVLGKEAFKRDFSEQLKKSPYWKSIEKTRSEGFDATRHRLGEAGVDYVERHESVSTA